MTLVVIESPLRGHVPVWCPLWLAPLVERFGRWQNRRYARACMRDSLERGECPYASHLLYDQPGILDDANPAQREQGIAAGFAWGARSELVAVYIDRGMSSGMQRGIARAHAAGTPVVHRSLRMRAT